MQVLLLLLTQPLRWSIVFHPVPVSNVTMIKMLTGMPNTLPVGLMWPKTAVKSLNRKLCCDLKNYEDFVNKIGSFSVTVNIQIAMFCYSVKNLDLLQRLWLKRKKICQYIFLSSNPVLLRKLITDIRICLFICCHCFLGLC